MIKIVVFDFDGVLTNTSSAWTILHEYFGSHDNKYFADLYEKGIISYLDWMKIDIALMIHSYGRPIKKIDVINALSRVKIRPEAERVVEELKKDGLITGVVSSGVDLLVEPACRRLGMDFCMYNELLFIADELVPGGKPMVPLGSKPSIIEKIAEKYGYTLKNVAYIGDSRWDIPVFQRVGLSIAVEPCGEACKYADYIVKNLASIPGIIRRINKELG